MRFARTEEAGNPYPVGGAIVIIGIEKTRKLALDLLGEDVFLHLGPQTRFVIGLDHALYGTADILLENGTQLGHDPPWTR